MRGIRGTGTSLVIALAVGCGSSGDHFASTGQASQGGVPPLPVPGPLCTHPDWPGYGPCDPDDPGLHGGPPQTECNLDGGTGGDAGNSGDGAPPPTACAFTPYNDGLAGGQISDVAYDRRSPGVAW